jgi:hypothetical protein
MNSIQKLLLTIGLMIASPFLQALTPQAAGKILDLEATLKAKYAIISDLNTQSSQLSGKERAEYKKGEYNLTIESIEKLRTEIGAAIKQITALDKAKGDTQIEKQNENFAIMNAWVKDGKIGTVEIHKIGNKTIEITGISQLQGPIDKILDKIKSLTSADPLYHSEIELLSSALDKYEKQVSAYKDLINAQYPYSGFDTNNIFLGIKEQSFVFSELRKQIISMGTKLESAKDKDGTLLTAQTSKWYQSRTVGERIKEQIASIKTDSAKNINSAIITIASEAAISRTITPDSPWIYAEKHLFMPFRKRESAESANLDANVKGSIKYILAKKDAEAKSLTDMLLIADAGKAISDYLKGHTGKEALTKDEAQIIKQCQEFAVTYARVTLEALDYTSRLLSGDTNALEQKELFNNTIRKNAFAMADSFKTFYDEQKALLQLDTIVLTTEQSMGIIADENTIKDIVDTIKTEKQSIHALQ